MIDSGWQAGRGGRASALQNLLCKISLPDWFAGLVVGQSRTDQRQAILLVLTSIIDLMQEGVSYSPKPTIDRISLLACAWTSSPNVEALKKRARSLCCLRELSKVLGPGPVFGGYEGNFCNLAN